MSELKLRQFPIKYDFDWEYGIKISKIREDLDKLEALGANHVVIESNISYDCDYITFEAIDERLETEDEMLDRVALHKNRQMEVERLEKRKLAELKRNTNNGLCVLFRSKT